MAGFNAKEERKLDMGVFVTRAATGKKEGVVAEAQLEPFGWGTDPLGSIERWRESMNCMCAELSVVEGEPQCGVCGGWPDDVGVTVHTDEDSGYPTLTFRLKANIGVHTTRPEKALRVIGQYLINMANRTPTSEGDFTGQLELTQEG